MTAHRALGDIGKAFDGPAVTQATSITTGVTCQGTSGKITTVSQTVAAAAEATFVVTNSVVKTNSVVLVTMVTNNGTGTFLAFVTDIQSGQFSVTVANLHASAAGNNTLVLRFLVLETQT
jgi:hypothetical protein